MKRLVLFCHLFAVSTVLTAQVQLQTGNATSSLPLFNWNDDKSKLNAGLSLEYNSAGGLKANDIASNVGQGWALIGGGVVTRMTIGLPDDQFQNVGNGTIEDINKYPNGYLYNEKDAVAGCPNALGYYPIFGDRNHVYQPHNLINADREQDYFFIQFNGRSLSFVLKKNNNDKALVLGDAKVKVWYDRNPSLMVGQHIRTAITAFYLQDETGLIYTFNKLGLTKLLRIHNAYPGPNPYPILPSDYEDQHVYFQNAFDDYPLSANPYVVNNWHLTSITDPLTQRNVVFNYETRELTSFSGNHITKMWSGGSYSQGNLPQKRYIVITQNNSITRSQVLKSIQCPDGNNVDISYDIAKPRFDLKGDYPIKAVDVTYNARQVSSFQFETSYFVLNQYLVPKTSAEKVAARLCLRSLTKVGVDGKEDQAPYTFDYYLGSNATEDFVPPPFHYATDIWGHYCGSNVNLLRTPSPNIPVHGFIPSNQSAFLFSLNFTQLSTLCFESNNINPPNYRFGNVKPGFAKNGLLKSISYPGGAKITYEYEQNILNVMTGTESVDRSNVNDGKYGGGVHVSKTSRTDGGYSNGESSPLVTTYKYVDETGEKTSQWGVEQPYTTKMSEYTFALDGAHHPFLGSCYYDFEFPGILSKEEALTIDNNKQFSIFSGITLLSALQAYFQITSLIQNPGLLLFDILVKLADYLLSSCDDGSQKGYTVADVNYNLGEVAHYPVQFSRVEVIPTSSSGGIGKTVHEFTDFTDYPLWGFANPVYISNPGSNMAIPMQHFAFWAYGLPKRVSQYNQDGLLTKEQLNKYDFTEAQRMLQSSSSCNCNVVMSTSKRSDVWATLNNPQNVTYSLGLTSEANSQDYTMKVYALVYSFYTGRVSLQESREKLYKLPGASQYLEKVAEYQYNPDNYQISKVVNTESNGDKLIKETFYSSDYTAAGVLQTMKDNNIIAPIATYSSIITAGTSTPKYLGAFVTEYEVIGTGDIRPVRQHSAYSNVPVSSFSFDPGNLLNYPGLTQSSKFTYDGLGNMIGVNDAGGHAITNLYDYNDKFIIATVLNADPLLDKVAYSSFETSNTGGWIVNGTPAYDEFNALTGKRGFVLNDLNLTPPASLSTNIIINKPYTLTFWAKSSVNVGNANFKRSGPTINGFTYYEYEVPAQSSSPYLTGHTIVDEVRLFPTASQIKTTTYDPLLGRTSECDENNRISYFEYDNLGRPRFVKDELGNIIKMFEYNIKQ